MVENQKLQNHFYLIYLQRFEFHHHQKFQRIPFLIIIGDKEEENNEISVRTREGEELGNMTLDSFKIIIVRRNIF